MPPGGPPDPTGNPFPCGGAGQGPCPPQPAANALAYTYEDMLAHGAASYAKGRLDVLTATTAKDEPEGSNL